MENELDFPEANITAQTLPRSFRVTLKVKLDMRTLYTLYYAYKVRNLVRCIRDCVVALLRFCGFQTPQKRNDAAIVCLRWHDTGLNSTDAYLFSRLDSFRIQTFDFHLSPHSNISV